MNSDTDNAILKEVKARHDIHDALVRYCRGVDRCDHALTLSAYHPDGYDDHGMFSGPAKDFTDWAIKLHLEEFVWTSHYITNEYVEIDGDKASAETYVQAILRFERDGALYDLVGCGRYLDKFECRNGKWKIAHRIVIGDWDRIDKVDERVTGDVVLKLTRGTRSPEDPSYSYFRRAGK